MLRRALALLAVLVLAAACSGGTTDSGQNETSTGTAQAGADGVQTITVTGDAQFRFHPSTIKAKPGKLKITLKTEGGTPHDLEVEATKANTGVVSGGEQKSVTVELDKPGTYKFVCTLHESSGMTGQIVVS